MLKKNFAILLALCSLIASVALAEPADPVLMDFSEQAGVPTHYLYYDRDYYDAPCEQAGEVIKVKYTTNLYDKAYKKFLNVYLPYGYDENGTERYPVLYFFHGRGCDPDTLIRNDATKNAFDHMIALGICRPFILVTATYYYGRGTNYDPEIFLHEMREEIMPLVEGTYRTYAETADDAGFRASRDFRAISGFSMGSGVTWTLLPNMTDYSRTFLPFSGAFSGLDAFAAVMENPEQPVFVYMASGGPEDGASVGCSELARKAAADPRFSYGTDPAENNFYYVYSDNIHQDLTSRYYLYNAFVDGVLWPVSDARE